jgi:presqualene diphosphate synthase
VLRPRRRSAERYEAVVSEPAGAGPTVAADPEALAHVGNVTRSSGSSFLAAMRLLARPRREAMYAIYAFCREVDDVADEPAPAADKLARLAEWRAEIDRLYAGMPRHPTARALAPAVRAYNLARADFIAIIEGMEMDVNDTMRAPPLAMLEAYCDRVAGAVGLLSIRVFGANRPGDRDFAVALGRALQCTNILRDLAEDAALGRLYLPREMLEAAGIRTNDPDAVLAHPALPAACSTFATYAEDRFSEAKQALGGRSPGPLRPAVMMMAVYRRLLGRMRRGGWRDPWHRVTLSRPEKLWIAFRYGFL